MRVGLIGKLGFGQSRSVLLIEDDPFLSNLLKGHLEREGMVVLLAQNADEAFRYLEGTRPILILLDILLPKKSGFEILEAIRSDPGLRSIPVIIISNLSSEADLKKGKELGAVDYYVKARISISDLTARVKDFLK